MLAVTRDFVPSDFNKDQCINHEKKLLCIIKNLYNKITLYSIPQ